DDGGFKYNPPNGGPADTGATKSIENRANEILAAGLTDVRRTSFAAALAASSTHRYDFTAAYVDDLKSAVDLDLVRDANLNIAADPLGGAGIGYWERIADRYAIPLTIQHSYADPTFRFMRVDWDGKIRMDCS